MRRKGTRWLALYLCMGLFVGSLSGCGGETKETSETIQVVCTIFPAYDWVREIAADVTDIEITMLVKNGTDLHSYQPSVQDIASIASADLFCYVGGTSDAWVDDALTTSDNDAMQTVSLVDVADADEEVIVEGMQADAHDHEHDETEDDTRTAELDEHVWLSLERAQLGCYAIRDALVQADPAHAGQYEENCAAYVEQLAALDTQFAETVQAGVRDVIVVPDRFPFRYLAEDYDLTYYAAFPGCSAETEASFSTIAFLAQQVQSLQLPCVLVTETSDQSLAKTVLENAGSGGEILTMHSLQSVSENDVAQGATYLSLMEENLETLRTALSMP